MSDSDSQSWWGVLGALVAGVVFGAGVVSGIIWLHRRFKNKKIAFLGMQGAGKTTCLDGLQALDAEQTDWVAGNPETTFSKKEDVVISVFGGSWSITDTGGTQELKRWDAIVGDADLVCYFYDLTQLGEKITNLEGEKHFYYKLAAADLRDLSNICEGKKQKLLIFATHADCEYDKVQAGKYQAEMLKECTSLPNEHIKCSLKDYASIAEFAKKFKEATK